MVPAPVSTLAKYSICLSLGWRVEFHVEMVVLVLSTVCGLSCRKLILNRLSNFLRALFKREAKRSFSLFVKSVIVSMCLLGSVSITKKPILSQVFREHRLQGVLWHALTLKSVFND